MAAQPRSVLGGRKRAMSAAPPASVDGCVITYYFNGRAFQRLFVESDIEGMKEVVRKKLGLPSSTELSLAQLADDQRIDLEDEADFSAFKFGTSIKPEISVEVSISTPPVAQLASPSITSPSLNFDPPPAGPFASSSRQPITEPSIAPAKPKKAKKPPAAPAASTDTSTAIDKSGRAVKQGEPAPKAPAPEPPVVPADNAPQPKPKKRSRKSGTEVEPETTAAAAPSNVNPSTNVGEPAEQPPPKKQRKSKAERAESTGPVARRKSVTATTAEKPAVVAPVFVGSNAEIIQRWASGSGPSTSKSVAPPTVPDADAAGSDDKPKKKKKKAKEIPVQALIEIPTENAPPVPTQCVVCLSVHPGSDSPLNCPLLSRRDNDIIGVVEERVKNLTETQGPSRIHQMSISRLRSWLKDRKKEVEVRNVFTPPIASTPAPKVNATKASKSSSASNPPGVAPAPSRPVVPKKSKLASVVVSRQSEGSSTDDDDIVKTVIQHESESDAESVEEDDARSGDEEVEVPAPHVEPARKPTPPSVVSVSATPTVAAIPLPSSSPDARGLFRSSQRLSQPNLLALLDDLEDEEAGKDQEEDSDGDEDDGGSELARSTPSDVARRRHRKSVRIEADDSDVGSVGEEEAPGGVDEDVEMGDVGDEGGVTLHSGEEPLRFSQILKSSQSFGGNGSQQSIAQDKGKGKEQQDDEIEEYESDEDAIGDETIIKRTASSPIEPVLSADDHPANADGDIPQSQSTESRRVTRQSMKADVEEHAAEDEGDAERAESPTPAPKKRGRPPLSQAVKDERAAEKVRIQAEKAAQDDGSVSPKKRGRPSLTKSVLEDKVAEKDAKVTKPRANVSSKAGDSNGNATIMSIELPAPKSRRLTSSQAKSDVSQGAEATIEAPATKKRGRPPLSQAAVAEREAEKERVRAEKAIKKLEARTAKANAKRAKGKEPGDAGSASEGPGDGADTTVDTTASGGLGVSNSPARDVLETEESRPEWEVLKVPPSSSSRANSSQLDEIESPLSQLKGGLAGSQKTKSIARSMLPKSLPVEEPDNENQSTTKGRSRPLFMPSSVPGKAGSTSLSFLPSSSPLVPVATSATPLQRRSTAAANLPRFSAIKKDHDLLRQQRRASQIPSSQPFNPEVSQGARPGDNEVLEIEESSSDENSSGDEATVTPSQKKRRSVLGYFSQG